MIYVPQEEEKVIELEKTKEPVSNFQSMTHFSPSLNMSEMSAAKPDVKPLEATQFIPGSGEHIDWLVS